MEIHIGVQDKRFFPHRSSGMKIEAKLEKQHFHHRHSTKETMLKSKNQLCFLTVCSYTSISDLIM